MDNARGAISVTGARFIQYDLVMSFLLRHLVRYGAQKFASDPRARQRAADTARVVFDEAKRVAKSDDRARAAGRAVRRAVGKLAR